MSQNSSPSKQFDLVEDASKLASRTIDNGRKVLARLDPLAFSPAPKASAKKEHPGKSQRTPRVPQPAITENAPDLEFDLYADDEADVSPMSRGPFTFLALLALVLAVGSVTVTDLTLLISPPPPPPPPSLLEQVVGKKAAFSSVLVGAVACLVVSFRWPRDEAEGGNLVTLRGGKTFMRNPSPARR